MADKVVHFEVCGNDGKRLRNFYTSLFGWKVDTNHYVAVADPAKALEQAAALGGKTLLEPMQVPGGPLIALLADPEGNAIGLVKAEDR